MRFARPSLMMRLTARGASVASRVFRAFNPSAEKLRQRLLARRYPVAPRPTASLRRLCTIREETGTDGFPVFHLTPRRNAGPTHVLYIHGGAYFLQLMTIHWWIVEQIIRQTGASVIVPVYPLAPEHDHRAAVAMIDTLYDDLVTRVGARNVVLSGDSAGGNFSVSLAQRLVASGRPLPAALLLFAPWLDVTMADPECLRVEREDPVLSIDYARMGGEIWAGTANPKDPLVSPFYGPVEGLPPMTVFQGSRDIVMPAARDFAARARQAEIKVDYHQYEGAIHVFNALAFLPESKDVYARIGEMFRRLEQDSHKAP